MTCPLFVIHFLLVAPYKEREDDAGLTRLNLSPNTVVSDPHCQQLGGQRQNVTNKNGSNNKTECPQKLMMEGLHFVHE